VDVFRSFRRTKETVPVGCYLTKTKDSLCVVTIVGARSGISWWLLDEDNIKITDSSFYLPMKG